MGRKPGVFVHTAETCTECAGPLRREGKTGPCDGRRFGFDGPLCGRCYQRHHGRLRPRKTGRRVGVRKAGNLPETARYRSEAERGRSRLIDYTEGHGIPNFLRRANAQLVIVDPEFIPAARVWTKVLLRRTRGVFGGRKSRRADFGPGVEVTIS